MSAVSKKFFIIGGYTYSNPGDQAILRATVDRLNGLYPGSHFVIWTDKLDFSLRLSQNISHEAFLFPPLPFLSKKFLGAGQAGSLYRRAYPLSARIIRRFLPRASAFIEKARSCDWAVFVGGGYINSFYNLPEISYLHYLVRECGVPYVLLGQTLGPFFRSQDRKMAEEICRGAKAVVLREALSEHAMNLNPSKTFAGVDDALSFEPDREYRLPAFLEGYFSFEVGDKPFLIGLNLKRMADARRYYPEVAQALKNFARSGPAGPVRVVFFPMESSVYCDDREELRYFKPHLRDFPDFRVVSEELSVEDRFTLVSRMDALVGMRFHSQVFALAQAVPCLGLYRGEYSRRKSVGLLRRFGIDRYALDLREAPRLEKMLEEIAAEKDEIRPALVRKKREWLDRQAALYEKIFA